MTPPLGKLQRINLREAWKHKAVTVDWAVRESVRARMRVMVKTLLRRHKYPPDRQEEAAETVLRQAELLSAEWVA